MAALKEGIGKQAHKGSSSKSKRASAGAAGAAAASRGFSLSVPYSLSSAAYSPSARRGEARHSVSSPSLPVSGSPSTQQRARESAAEEEQAAAAEEEEHALRTLPVMDVVLRQPRDDFSEDVERQLADGTCPTLDARLRTHTLLEQEDTRLLLNASASGGIPAQASAAHSSGEPRKRTCWRRCSRRSSACSRARCSWIACASWS